MPDGIGFNPAHDAAIQRQKALSAAAQGAGSMVDKKQVKQEKTATERGIEQSLDGDDVFQVQHKVVDSHEDNILAAEVTSQLDDSISDDDTIGGETAEEEDVHEDAQMEVDIKKQRKEQLLTVQDAGAAAKDKLKMADLLGVRKKIDLEKLSQQTGLPEEGVKAALRTVETQLTSLAEEAEKLSFKPVEGQGELAPGKLAPIAGASVELAPIADKTTPLFQESSEEY